MSLDSFGIRIEEQIKICACCHLVITSRLLSVFTMHFIGTDELDLEQQDETLDLAPLELHET